MQLRPITAHSVQTKWGQLRLGQTTTTTTILRLTRFCPGQPGGASTRRNIHPLTPIVVINHPLSASSIYYDPWHPPCSIYVPHSLFPQYLFKFSLVYLLRHLIKHTLAVFLKLCPAFVCFSDIGMCWHQDAIVGLNDMLNSRRRLFPQPSITLVSCGWAWLLRTKQITDLNNKHKRTNKLLYTLHLGLNDTIWCNCCDLLIRIC